LFHCVFDESGRWRTAHIDFWYCNLDDYPIISLSQHPPFALLEEVTIECPREPLGGELLRAFGRSLRLKKLIVKEDCSEIEEVISDIPWSQLAELELQDDDLFIEEETLAKILLLCSNLRTFRAASYGWKKQDDHYTTPLSTSHAHTIVELSLTDSPDLANRIASDLTLSNLVLPSLRHLRVNHQFEHDVDQIIDLIERSDCDLISLCYSGWYSMPEGSIERVLRTPRIQRSLQKLTIKGPIYGSALLKCFFDASNTTYPTTSSTFLPKLQELSIERFIASGINAYGRLLGRTLPSRRFGDIFCQLGVTANFTNDSENIRFNVTPLTEHSLVNFLWNVVTTLKEVDRIIPNYYSAAANRMDVVSEYFASRQFE